MAMDVHQSMSNFRLASRELFNHYFAVPQPPAEPAYEYYDGFNEVERVLFAMLVLEPCAVPPPNGTYNYGLDAHPGIQVRLPIANFDWNCMTSRDNAYVQVQVGAWPSHPEAIGSVDWSNPTT
jgi:hypothetical protein